MEGDPAAQHGSDSDREEVVSDWFFHPDSCSRKTRRRRVFVSLWQVTDPCLGTAEEEQSVPQNGRRKTRGKVDEVKR